MSTREIDVTFDDIQANGTGSDSPAIVIYNNSGSFEITGTSNQSEISNYVTTTLAGNPLFPEVNQVGGIVIVEDDDGNDSIDANDDEYLDVNLNNLLMEGNNSALVARNIDVITIDQLEVNDSVNSAIEALNTRFFGLTNSGGEENGGPLEPVINLLYNTTRDDDDIYQVYYMSNTLNNVGFTDSNSTILSIQAVTTINDDVFSIGASSYGINSDTDLDREMGMYFEVSGGNIFTFEDSANIDDLAAIDVGWNGSLAGIVGSGSTSSVRNFFNLGSINLTGDAIGINISNNTDESDEDTDLVIENNLFQTNSDTGNTIAMNFEVESELDVLINNNVVQTLTQTENTTTYGYVFDVGSDSDIVITSNTLTLGPDAGVALLFDRIQGPSRVNISHNLLQLEDLNLGGPLEQGVIFNTIFGTVDLSSTVDNIFSISGFTGTEIIFSAPAGSTTGGISINGVVYP